MADFSGVSLRAVSSFGYIRVGVRVGGVALIWLAWQNPRNLGNFMTVHAFIDESRRADRYLVAVAIAHPASLISLRRALRTMLLPGCRELHFRKESDRRRRYLADTIARLPVEAIVYSTGCDMGEESARQACFGRLTEDLLARDAHRMVIDSRSTRDGNDPDALDRETIRAALGKRPSETRLVYEHVLSTSEEILWVADAVAWCWGQEITTQHQKRETRPPTVRTVDRVHFTSPQVRCFS
jgi:hypothetical protein